MEKTNATDLLARRLAILRPLDRLQGAPHLVRVQFFSAFQAISDTLIAVVLPFCNTEVRIALMDSLAAAVLRRSPARVELLCCADSKIEFDHRLSYTT